jgi:serine/threonine protein kinase
MPVSHEVPSVLSGRYQVLRKLGEGGMAVVYIAQDKSLGCEVVVKMPLRNLLDEPGFAERFAREIRSMVMLTHPHVVKIQDVGSQDGVPFCVMQYLAGGSLHDRPRPAEVDSLRTWLPAVAGALDFVHGQGFLHRDIKPANILFDAHGNAYISDFGVAKVLSEKAARQGTTVLTGEGLVVGTIGYLAPELIMGAEKVTGKADQYALAATVYQVLAGRLPFEGKTPSAVLVQQAAEPAPPLRQFAAKVPRHVAEAVEKGLHKDPAKRHASCAAFADAVLQAVAGRAAAPRPAAPARGETPAKPARKSSGSTVPSAVPAKSAVRRPVSDEGSRPTKPHEATAPVKPPSRQSERGVKRAPSPVAEERGGGRTFLVVGAAVLFVAAVAGGVFVYRATRAGRKDAPAAPAGGFNVKPPEEVTARPGNQTPVTIRIVRNNYDGPVRIACAEPPAGVTLSEETIGHGQSEATLRVGVTDRAKGGQVDIPVRLVGDGVSEKSLVLTVHVLRSAELKLGPPADPVALRPGGEGVAVQVRVERVGCPPDQIARFLVAGESPPWLTVTPRQGEIKPDRDGFTVRVGAEAGATPGRTLRLPITILMNLREGKPLSGETYIELRVDPLGK